MPYPGWRNHHTKEFSKVDKESRVLYEMGELPLDTKRKRVEASEEEKKLKLDDVLIEMKKMYEDGATDDEVFKRFPKHSLNYGEKIKSMVS